MTYIRAAILFKINKAPSCHICRTPVLFLEFEHSTRVFVVGGSGVARLGTAKREQNSGGGLLETSVPLQGRFVFSAQEFGFFDWNYYVNQNQQASVIDEKQGGKRTRALSCATSYE